MDRFGSRRGVSKTGFPILARFRYILVDQTMTNILR